MHTYLRAAPSSRAETWPWRITNYDVNSAACMDLFLSAIFPILLSHERLADTPCTSAHHDRQTFGTWRRKSYCCRQPADETAASDHQSFPVPLAKTNGAGSLPDGFLVTFSPASPYSKSGRDCPAIDAVEVSPIAQTAQILTTLFFMQQLQTWPKGSFKGTHSCHCRHEATQSHLRLSANSTTDQPCVRHHYRQGCHSANIGCSLPA